MKETFDEVSVRATRRWKDANGRKRQETKKFWQTINPFNKGTDSLPKSRSQIMSELIREREEWLARPQAKEKTCGQNFAERAATMRKKLHDVHNPRTEMR